MNLYRVAGLVGLFVLALAACSQGDNHIPQAQNTDAPVAAEAGSGDITATFTGELKPIEFKTNTSACKVEGDGKNGEVKSADGSFELKWTNGAFHLNWKTEAGTYDGAVVGVTDGKTVTFDGREGGEFPVSGAITCG